MITSIVLLFRISRKRRTTAVYIVSEVTQDSFPGFKEFKSTDIYISNVTRRVTERVSDINHPV